MTRSGRARIREGGPWGGKGRGTEWFDLMERGDWEKLNGRE